MRKYFFILFLFFVLGSALGQDTLLQIDSTIDENVKVEMQKSAGVQVRANSGAPGASMDIVVRGRGGHGSDTLYVVNGIVMGGICEIDKHSAFVKTYEVIKEDSWDTRGASTIILITTKSQFYTDTTYALNSLPKCKFGTEATYIESIEERIGFKAKHHNIKESIYVLCEITKTGQIDVWLTNVEYDFIFNQYLISAIESDISWIPAHSDGENVSSLYMFEFNFDEN